jgi:acetyl-CoA/propionyl-CoA carboxylase biotin carboxyl carrier protein
VEVGGKRIEVTLPAGLGASTGGGSAKAAGPKKRGGKKAGGGATGDSLTAPMQGTIVKVEVEEGQVVAAGDLIVVLEAMKMEQPLTAHKAGTITGLNAEAGTTVPTGTVLCEIKD